MSAHELGNQEDYARLARCFLPCLFYLGERHDRCGNLQACWLDRFNVRFSLRSPSTKSPTCEVPRREARCSPRRWLRQRERSGQVYRPPRFSRSKGLRKTLLAYRDGARMVAGTKLTGMEYLKTTERIGIQMLAAGFSVRAAVVLFSTIYNYTLSFVMEEQAMFLTPGEPSPATQSKSEMGASTPPSFRSIDRHRRFCSIRFCSITTTGVFERVRN